MCLTSLDTNSSCPRGHLIGSDNESAEKGVCVNAFGTNFLNYPDAVESYGGEEAMAHVASKLSVGRFGEPEEAAHLAAALLDGKNMFTTGQTIMVAGGYNSRMDDLKFTKW